MYINSLRPTFPLIVVSFDDCHQELGEVNVEGMVIQVLDKSFDVVVKRLGMIKRVYCEVICVCVRVCVCVCVCVRERERDNLVFSSAKATK